MPTDKGTYHSYLELYEPLFRPLRNSATDVLEIGIADGSSLNIWAQWFPNATIHGVDIVKVGCEDPRIRLIHGNVCDPTIVAQLADRSYDIIIDDGSHVLAEQLAALRFLFPHLKPGGFYVIEDIQNWRTNTEEMFRMAAQFMGAQILVLDRRAIKGVPDDILLVFTR